MEEFEKVDYIKYYFKLDNRVKFTEIFLINIFALIYFKNLTVLILILPISMVVVGVNRLDGISPFQFIAAIIRIYINDSFMDVCVENECISK